MQRRPFDLSGRSAMVTGASMGIGRATALILAQAGADVVLASRREPLLEEVSREIEALGRRALVRPLDVRDKAAIFAAVEHAEREFGKLDILVNNAGAHHSMSLEEMTEEAWYHVLDVNLKGTLYCCQAAVPGMKKRRYGRIVNIASITGQTGGVSGPVNYSASKGGILSMTKTMARDLAPYNITVNSIAPGQIDTRMGRLPQERLEALLELIPLGRLGRPEEIGYAVLFLASHEAGYITGATLDVNGGILKR